MIGFITVRTSSSRLNNKCLLKFGSYNTLIEFIIQRCRDYKIEPIICTSLDSSDDIIEKISSENNVKIYRGSLDNKIKRWSDCADFFQVDSFHSIDADDPFFDGQRMKESMQLLIKGDYDYVKPSFYSDNGGASEGYSISTEFLNKVALEHNSNNLDTEMAVYYFDNMINSRKSVMLDPIYSIKVDQNIPRLTLDYFEDYILLNFLELSVQNNNNRSSIEKFISANENVVSININLNKVWKESQKKKNIFK